MAKGFSSTLLHIPVFGSNVGFSSHVEGSSSCVRFSANGCWCFFYVSTLVRDPVGAVSSKSKKSRFSSRTNIFSVTRVYFFSQQTQLVIRHQMLGWFFFHWYPNSEGKKNVLIKDHGGEWHDMTVFSSSLANRQTNTAVVTLFNRLLLYPMVSTTLCLLAIPRWRIFLHVDDGDDGDDGETIGEMKTEGTAAAAAAAATTTIVLLVRDAYMAVCWTVTRFTSKSVSEFHALELFHHRS